MRNSLAGVQLGANARIWHPDGSVGEINLPIIPGTTRAVQFFSQQLHYGYLVHAAVTKLAGAPNRGNTLVSMQVARPPVGSFATKWFLGQDYVTGMSAVYWPFGRMLPGIEGPGALFSLAVSNPAAGAEFVQTVPTGARWLLHAARGSLLTSGTVGNRQPQLRFTDGTNTLAQTASPLTQAAGLPQLYFWEPSIPTLGVAVSSVNVAHFPFPIPLLAGWQISSASGVLAGDQWSSIFLDVEEWLED